MEGLLRGGKYLVLAVTQGGPDEKLYGNFPTYSRLPDETQRLARVVAAPEGSALARLELAAGRLIDNVRVRGGYARTGVLRKRRQANLDR